MNKEFEINKYLFLENFLHIDSCNEFTQQFKNIIEKGEAKVDDQCPLSYSLGHSPLFDQLLEQVKPNIEQATGINLIPTYAYARWYAPGEELKIHKDRPSCEISVTLTLGFDGSPWPIYFGNDESKQNKNCISMNRGDAVIYKGEELFHWREKYTEGQWQAQVFLHYVDANGKNKEWAYDKRGKLSHHLENENLNYEIFYLKNGLSNQTCEGIIRKLEDNMEYSEDAALVGNVVDKSVRDTKRIHLPIDQGIGSTLTGMGLFVNKKIWNFNVTHSNQSEFLRYDNKGHFSSHIDTVLHDLGDTRKITIIAILNDDFEGGKLYIQTGSKKYYPFQEKGTVLFFPSFLLHGVEPVISGIRRSIVTWLVGPYWK